MHAVVRRDDPDAVMSVHGDADRRSKNLGNYPMLLRYSRLNSLLFLGCESRAASSQSEEIWHDSSQLHQILISVPTQLADY
jgi:hypothetical protein